jgi:hypothetical protein
VFGLGLQDVGSEERDALWDRVAAAHAAYATSRDAGLTSKGCAPYTD